MSAVEIHDIPLEQIEVDPQVRKHLDEAMIRAIMLSIATFGVMDPIHVRRDGKRLVIVDGEHRYVAAKRAGLKTIPGIIEAGELIKKDWLPRQLIGNSLRTDLNPIDKANAIKEFMELSGLNAADTANRLGFSPSMVTQHLKLLSLSPEIQTDIASGKIAASAGSELAGIEDLEQRAEFARQVASHTLTRDGLVGALKARKNGSAAKEEAETNRVTAVLSGGRKVTVVAPRLDMEVVIDILAGLLSEARKSRTRGVALPTFLRILKDQSTNP